MNTTRGLIRTVARNSAIKLAVIFGGFALGYAVELQFGPAAALFFEHPSQAPGVFAPRPDPEEFTAYERAAWLTDDCTIPAVWPKDEIPGSAIVRDDTTHRMARVGFAAALTGAEAGTRWTLALCSRGGAARTGTTAH